MNSMMYAKQVVKSFHYTLLNMGIGGKCMSDPFRFGWLGVENRDLYHIVERIYEINRKNI